ncbi:MAG: M24 family metallopeptidase [Candidatus Hodarchaeota archaeon]
MEKDNHKTKKIKEIMEKHDIDVIISRYTENVLYFTNVWPITGWGISVVYRDSKEPVLFLPVSEMDYANHAIISDVRAFSDTSLMTVAGLLEGLDIKKMKVGLELSKEGLAASHLSYEVAFPNQPTFNMIRETLDDCTIVDATGVIDKMRACKTDFELKQLKLVNELNYFGLEAAAELLHEEGVTEMEVATECEKKIMDRIKDYPDINFIRALAFVMAGENGIKGDRPFNISSAYKCKKGEYVMLELNTQVNGYWSDLTRTWVCGRKPTEEQLSQAEAVNGGIEAAMSVMKPGGSWRDAYEKSREYIVKKGYGKYHSPFLGHGIGVKLHESVPMIHGSTDPSLLFEKGHYLSVEPGLYYEKVGALRYERNVAVGEKGCEAFDEFPCTL